MGIKETIGGMVQKALRVGQDFVAPIAEQVGEKGVAQTLQDLEAGSDVVAGALGAAREVANGQKMKDVLEGQNAGKIAGGVADFVSTRIVKAVMDFVDARLGDRIPDGVKVAVADWAGEFIQNTVETLTMRGFSYVANGRGTSSTVSGDETVGEVRDRLGITQEPTLQLGDKSKPVVVEAEVAEPKARPSFVAAHLDKGPASERSAETRLGEPPTISGGRSTVA